MDKKVRVGVFGGYRGNTMIQVLSHHPDAELVAVCDKYQPILDKVVGEARESGIDVALFNNFDDFLQYDMDAVVLANYADEHAVYAIRCLERGLHVLSEVLPCQTMSQAVELIEAVEKSKKVYAYAENYCYMQSTFEMWQKYEQGTIGQVEYCEGEYIHDCSAIWPSITYGDRNHWRNRMPATFYCTHSIGPMLTVTGRRPVQVVGFETKPREANIGLGTFSGTGIEIITLDNGAIARSVHGGLKREPGSVNYQFYGSRGMMESGRLPENKVYNQYTEGEKLCEGNWQKYDPETSIEKSYAEKFGSHGGSDFYATHFFIEKILGREIGRKYSIDVYHAVDMGICGLLAYRSVLNGNTPVAVPDLRDPAQREAFRSDRACTNPAVAGDQLQPVSSYPVPEIPDRVYDYVKDLWLHAKDQRAEHPCPGYRD